MNGKQLKNSILQWAIQGKLVPQDPNDEPASELLKRVRAEKARLVKEGKIKKDKNESIIYRDVDNSYYEKFADGTVKCIDDEIPFDVPKGWEWARLRHISELLSGQDFPPDKYNDRDEGIPYLTGASNLEGDSIILNRWTKSPSVIARQGDLLLVCKGSGVGKMCIMNIPEAHIARQLQAIRPILNDVNIWYIRMSMECRLNEITQQANGVIPGIARDAALDFLIPICSLHEQERIVHQYYRRINPKLQHFAKVQIQKENLDIEIFGLLKKSVLQEAIQGKLVPQDPVDEPASMLLEKIQIEKQRLVKEGILKKKDLVTSTIIKGDDNKYFEKIGNKVLDISDEIPFDIPDTWVFARLSTIANLYTGDSISETEKQSKYTNVSGMDYIGTKDVGFDGTVTYSNGVNIPREYLDNFKVAKSGSVLMCVEGGSAGRKIAVIDHDVCFGNKLCCFMPYADIARYIFYYLQTPTFFDTFQQNKTGIIGGVSVNILKRLIIAIPPLGEICRITEYLDAVIASIMSR